MTGQLFFSKLVATGNDFLFIDARNQPMAQQGVATRVQIPAEKRVDLAKRLCHRHFGVGADGLVFVEDGEGPSSTTHLKWDFYNSDGSIAEMCGNATRCMGRWAAVILGEKQIEFKTRAGQVRTRLEGPEIVSQLDFVQASLKPLTFELGDRKQTAFLVDTGVPHAVFEVASVARAAEHQQEIKALRFHPSAGARGANVTFFERLTPRSFKTVTFERGVEGFTLSCGTGVLAAAAVGLAQAQEKTLLADLETPGGRLQVKYGPGFEGVELKGPAEWVFSGHVSL